ncbi:MAG: SDR family NAD(P)-dependent oxidoreductase [Spartobacteria bacterium]
MSASNLVSPFAKNPFDLTGRRALVTGSTQGIGAAIAMALAEAGADVAINHPSERACDSEVLDQIKSLGREAVCIPATLGTPDSAKHLFLAAAEALGGIDILVSNVAVQFAEGWESVTPDHFDTQVRTNWQSAFELIQHAAPGMLERGWGRIVTVGSVQEAKPHPQMVVYAALKAAQTSMVRNLAKQFAPRGVTVNSLAPGVINTDRSRARLTDPAYVQTVLSWIPAGSIGEASDCAGAALLLCSDAGRYITGQSLFIDGGMSL